MKTTSKILVAVIALFIIASSGAFAKGGGNNRLSIGLEVGLPMGDFGDAVNTGFGGSARYEMPMGDNLGLTGTVGYLSFGAKDVPAGISVSWSMIPIMVGAKYYFTEQQNEFYGAFALGITMSTVKATGSVMGIDISSSASESDLTFGPGVGYHLDNLDFGLNYNIISTEGSSSSYLGLRVAYVLGAK